MAKELPITRPTAPAPELRLCQLSFDRMRDSPEQKQKFPNEPNFPQVKLMQINNNGSKWHIEKSQKEPEKDHKTVQKASQKHKNPALPPDHRRTMHARIHSGRPGERNAKIPPRLNRPLDHLFCYKPLGLSRARANHIARRINLDIAELQLLKQPPQLSRALLLMEGHRGYLAGPYLFQNHSGSLCWIMAGLLVSLLITAADMERYL